MGSTPSKISASRGAAILGESHWSTPLESWIKIMAEEKPEVLKSLGIEVPQFETSAPMRWGLAFENAVLTLAEELEDELVVEREKLFIHPEHNFLTCHIDGRYANTRRLHEGKTTNIRSFRDTWGEPGTDHVPIEYQVQCQHQMICSGSEEVVLSVLVFPTMVDEWEQAGIVPEEHHPGVWMLPLNPGLKVNPLSWAMPLMQMGYFHRYYIKRNAVVIEKMLELYAKWWQAYVIGETPPPAESYSDIRQLLVEPKGTIVANMDVEALVSEDKAIAEEMKLAQKRRDQIKTTVGQYMVDNLEGVPIDNASREKVILLSRSGYKLKSYSKKGGLR